MENIRCIKHRDYTGSTAPVLSCKACCAIYINAIKMKQLAQKQNEHSPANELAPAGNYVPERSR
jgi:hypothetical protein